MPSNKKLLQAAAGNAGESLYVEDVFSTYVYAGNSTAGRAIVNGIDLSGEGGLVWHKRRTGTGENHYLYDTERGATKDLRSNQTNAEDTSTGGLTSFNSNGFTYGTYQETGQDYVSWSFRKAKKFFDVVTFTGNGQNDQTISHSLGSVPGMILVKRTDATSDWIAYNSTGSAYKQMVLNTTAGNNSDKNFDQIATDSTLKVGHIGGTTNVGANGQTCVAYLFASDAGGFGDDGDENIIKCGSFSGTGQVDLGFEPQWVLIKPYTQTYDWELADITRRFDATSSSVLKLEPNTSDAEAGGSELKINATGFNNQTFGTSYPCIYVAIRRPMKTPESGTEVFAPKTRSGSGAIVTTGAGFTPDVFYNFDRTYGGSNGLFDRLRGRGILQTMSTAVENTTSPAIYDLVGFDTMDGVELGGAYNINMTSSGRNFVDYYFKRATGFMDVVAYTGNGASSHAITHNLGVSPELIITKRRDATGDWRTATNFSASAYSLYKVNEVDPATNINYAAYGMYAAKPTATNFTVGSGANVNASSGTYVSYLFGTVAGVSKVGSVVHSGTTNVDCGFSAGARFVMAKRADQNSGWFIWDSSRGIVSGNDPYVLANSSAAEVTNTDYIDPLSSGFTLTSSLTAGTYIFLAIA